MKNDIPITLVLGADHGGFALKEDLAAQLADYQVVDVGDKQLTTDDDYPLFAELVAGHVRADDRALGVLICRSAEGMAIAANKVDGVRAAVVADAATATLAREHNDANVITLSGDHLKLEDALAIVTAFIMAAPSDEGRHVRRRAEIERVEHGRLEVIPGVFRTDTAEVAQRLRELSLISDKVHIDVADGALVPTTALVEPTEAAKLVLPTTAEIHLMVERPADYVPAWRESGATRFIGHVEAPGFGEFLEASRVSGAETVAGIDLGTDPETLEPYLDSVNGVLVMTVKAGKSGQDLDPEGLAAIVRLREAHPHLSIEADGGETLATSVAVLAAGANRVVATSSLEVADDPAVYLAKLANPAEDDGQAG